jgi:hypothetical protein
MAVTDAEEMVDLMRYASQAKVAAALGVSRTTTGHWAKGRDVTPYRVRQVRDLLRPETARDAAPVEGRLLAGTIALERKLGVTPGELAEAEAEAAVLIAHLLGGTETPPRRSADGVAGAGGD